MTTPPDPSSSLCGPVVLSHVVEVDEENVLRLLLRWQNQSAIMLRVVGLACIGCLLGPSRRHDFCFNKVPVVPPGAIFEKNTNLQNQEGNF